MYERIGFTYEMGDAVKTYLEWEGEAFGMPVSGSTTLTRNAAGLIESIRLHHRPLSMVVRFSAELGRRLHGQVDPALFDHLALGPHPRDKFAALKCRSAVILGETSDDDGAQAGPDMCEITQGITPIFNIPGTHHHLMFEEPIALAMAMQAISLTWIQARRADELAAARGRRAAVRSE